MEGRAPKSKFVDSNVFIYVLMNDPAHGGKALRILTGIEEGREIGWTSTLALSQVFSHLKNRGRHEAIDRFYDYLQGSPISVTPTSLEDITEARKAKEEQDRPWSMWDDLVIASQMARLGITEIYSNDADFDELKGLKRSF